MKFLSGASESEGLYSSLIECWKEGEPPEGEKMPSLGGLDRAEFPCISDDVYAAPATELAIPDVVPQIRNDDEVFDNSLALCNLTTRAIKKIEEILKLDLHISDKKFDTLLKTQMTAAQVVLNSQIKVDEQQFRRAQVDKLPELLSIILEEKENLSRKGGPVGILEM